MVNVLANLNIVMCHAFIQNKTEMPPPTIIFSYSSQDENSPTNIFVNDDEAS
jgi:hypothetical protein